VIAGDRIGHRRHQSALSPRRGIVLKRSCLCRSLGDRRCGGDQPRSEFDRLQQQLLPNAIDRVCGHSICPMPGVRERHGSSGLKTGGGANGAIGAGSAARACQSAGGPRNRRAEASKLRRALLISAADTQLMSPARARPSGSRNRISCLLGAYPSQNGS
jgi:hypothetical protein